MKIFAISVDGPQSASKVKPFMNRYKYDFSALLPPESKVIALYNPRVILPYSLLIDKQGRIRYVHQGYSPGDEKTMEAKTQKGLYFIGECVDVTGWLGGYNFQWAWASGFAAGQAIRDD